MHTEINIINASETNCNENPHQNAFVRFGVPLSLWHVFAAIIIILMTAIKQAVDRVIPR
jgi:hypothetical protein